jgi:hypothetical protein
MAKVVLVVENSSNGGRNSTMDDYKAHLDTSQWVRNPNYRKVPSKYDAPRDDHIHGLPPTPYPLYYVNNTPVFRQLEPKPIGAGPPRFEDHKQYINKYSHMFEEPRSK